MTNSIRFYWNGIRINGEKSLIKCSYSLDNSRDHKECVSIYADGCSSLPRDLFEVQNETDLYTDYFDSDHADLTPEHPLYKYARYAAAKAEMRYLTRHIEYLESLAGSRWENPAELEAKKARLAAYQAIENPGHPTAEDLAKIEQMRVEAENARIAAEKEAKQKAREAMLAKKNAGRHFIKDVAEKHPIREGEPVVTINWSEHPAFYSWKDGELKLSVAAAEIILKHFDEEVHAEQGRGYDKTSFTITYVNEDGEQDTYEGRYDLGDNDGGMIEHIRAWGRFLKEKGSYGNSHPTEEDIATGKEIMAFADMLEGYSGRAKAIALALAPWAEKAVRDREKAENKDMAMLLYMVQKMSDEELTEAAMAISPDDRHKEKVAEFFIQQLGMRDINKALAAHQAWKNQ